MCPVIIGCYSERKRAFMEKQNVEGKEQNVELSVLIFSWCTPNKLDL